MSAQGTTLPSCVAAAGDYANDNGSSDVHQHNNSLLHTAAAAAVVMAASLSSSSSSSSATPLLFDSHPAKHTRAHASNNNDGSSSSSGGSSGSGGTGGGVVDGTHTPCGDVGCGSSCNGCCTDAGSIGVDGVCDSQEQRTSAARNGCRQQQQQQQHNNNNTAVDDVCVTPSNGLLLGASLPSPCSLPSPPQQQQQHKTHAGQATLTAVCVDDTPAVCELTPPAAGSVCKHDSNDSATLDCTPLLPPSSSTTTTTAAAAQDAARVAPADTALVVSLVQPCDDNATSVVQTRNVMHELMASARKLHLQEQQQQQQQRQHQQPQRVVYVPGMRVEGRWGRRWWPATVVTHERGGYVQLRWDEDDSLLHMRVKEVRTLATQSATQHASATVVSAMATRRTDEEAATAAAATTAHNDDVVDTRTPTAAAAAASCVLRVRATDMGPLPQTLRKRPRTRSHAATASVRSVTSTVTMPRMAAAAVAAVLDGDNKGDGNVTAHAVATAVTNAAVVAATDDNAPTHATAAAAATAVAGTCGDGAAVVTTACAAEPTLLLPQPTQLTYDECDVIVQHHRASSPRPHARRQQQEQQQEEATDMRDGAVQQQQVQRQGEDVVTAADAACLSPAVRPVVMPRHDLVRERAAAAAAHGDDNNNTRDDDEAHAQRTASGNDNNVDEDNVDEDDAAAALPPVLVGEDYYAMLDDSDDSDDDAVASNVVLGRVLACTATHATLQLYELKDVTRYRHPRTRRVQQHTTLYLGMRTAQVPLRALLFDTPVYVVDAAALQHVYTLEDAPPPPPQQQEQHDVATMTTLPVALHDAASRATTTVPVTRSTTPTASLRLVGRADSNKNNASNTAAAAAAARQARVQSRRCRRSAHKHADGDDDDDKDEGSTTYDDEEDDVVLLPLAGDATASSVSPSPEARAVYDDNNGNKDNDTAQTTATAAAAGATPCAAAMTMTSSLLTQQPTPATTTTTAAAAVTATPREDSVMATLRVGEHVVCEGSVVRFRDHYCRSLTAQTMRSSSSSMGSNNNNKENDDMPAATQHIAYATASARAAVGVQRSTPLPATPTRAVGRVVGGIVVPASHGATTSSSPAVAGASEPPWRWGRVQMLRRMQDSVVLVVHTAAPNSVFGGSKMCVITPDMIVDVLHDDSDADDAQSTMRA